MTSYLGPPGVAGAIKRVALVATLAAIATVIALAAAPQTAQAYTEQYFCQNRALDAYFGMCRAAEYHHLAKVNANAVSGEAFVCAYSFESNLRDFTDPKCFDGFVSKILDGHAGYGACKNGEGYDIRMDYCVQKF